MWYGRDQLPPQVMTCRAGLLDVEFENGDLRYVHLGNRELIRRVYVAIRDANWNTIPAHISDLAIETAADRFHIRFAAFHQARELAFRWQATITGQSDGTIDYRMQGIAESAFRYCRIGFCVLHPIAGIAGCAYQVQTPDGQRSGLLPERIEPQRIENGFEVPLFPACSSLTIHLQDGMAVTTDFTGDLFEMEDQRNWTDTSFKTYCTPLSLGYPHSASVGQVFNQSVTIKVVGSASTQLPVSVHDHSAGMLDLTFAESPAHPLPAIGFGLPSHDQPVTAQEAERLAQAAPDHLTLALDLHAPDWERRLEQAADLTTKVGAGLELALFVSEDTTEALPKLAARLRRLSVPRVFIFHPREAPYTTTSQRWIDLVRQQWAADLPSIPLYGGTTGNFAEINRKRPNQGAFDGLVYTINPQVHGFDERTLVENLNAQGDTLLTARSFFGDLPIAVSAVTLRPPFNQAALEPEAAPEAGTLPASVDPRQMSLFCAAWTVGSLRALITAGANALTYYETTGWRGLMETAQGSPLMNQFRSFPEMIFPVYWVFAFLGGHKDCVLVPGRTTTPLLLDGFALHGSARQALVAANLQPRPQVVRLQGLPEGTARLQRLNDSTFAVAAAVPDTFRALSQPLETQHGQARLVLEAYETIFISFLS
jgi:hypothetical protein